MTAAVQDRRARRVFDKVDGGATKGTCLVTVLGQKWTTPSGHTFADPSAQTLIVYALPLAHRKPTPAQLRECEALWLSDRTAPPAYLFPSHRLPAVEDGCGSAAPLQLTTNEEKDQ